MGGEILQQVFAIMSNFTQIYKNPFYDIYLLYAFKHLKETKCRDSLQVN